jgi:molybdopterin-guanine dinucleotide biosynthesis protein A
MFDVEGFILVGGASRRMGRDKALLTVGRRTMLERVADELAAVVSSVRLVGAQKDYPVGFPNVPDIQSAYGALGGIHAALAATSAEWALVVACDLPLVTSQLLERLAQYSTGSKDAVVPVQADGRPQPVCALYRREACLPEIEDLIRADEHTPRALLDRVRTQYVQFSELRDLPGAENFFLNLNTPEDFLRAKQLLETRSV